MVRKTFFESQLNDKIRARGLVVQFLQFERENKPVCSSSLPYHETTTSKPTNNSHTLSLIKLYSVKKTNPRPPIVWRAPHQTALPSLSPLTPCSARVAPPRALRATRSTSSAARAVAEAPAACLSARLCVTRQRCVVLSSCRIALGLLPLPRPW